MFTGLIECLGHVKSIKDRDGFKILTLELAEANSFAEQIGDSIAVNGCCLTVTRKEASELSFDVSHETLAKTSLGQLRNQSLVNLERALKVGDRLGGHMVAGHVDAVGEVLSNEQLPGGWDVWISLPIDFAAYVIAKGSIAIDGISLTINELKDISNACHIRLTLIPLTMTKTNAQNWQKGDQVNIEVDLVGKYMERIAKVYVSTK